MVQHLSFDDQFRALRVAPANSGMLMGTATGPKGVNLPVHPHKMSRAAHQHFLKPKPIKLSGSTESMQHDVDFPSSTEFVGMSADEQKAW